MTSRVVHARARRFGFVGGLLTVAFLLMAALAIVLRNADWALATLLPAVLLAGILIGRPASRRVVVDETGLTPDDARETIPYRNICALSVNSVPCLLQEVPERGTVRIVTPSRILVLAGKLDVSRRALFGVLFDRVPRGGEMPYQPELQEFARSQREQFGNDRVWTFRAADRARRRTESFYIGWGLALVAVVWMLRATVHHAWAAGAVVAVLFALLIWARASKEGRSRRYVGPRWLHSGLVIAPTGLAMMQGRLRGKARWSEITSARFVSGTLLIDMAGVKFIIADIYDRPIQQIVELVWLYMGAGRSRSPGPTPKIGPAASTPTLSAATSQGALKREPSLPRGDGADLVPGIHPADVEEFRRRFGSGSERRTQLGQRLQRIWELTSATGQLGRFFVFGSFVSTDPEPYDAAVFLLMEDAFDVKSLAGDTQLIFNHLAARSRIGVRIFWLRRRSALDGVEAAIDQWGMKRDGSRRGLIEIVAKPP